MPRRKVTRLRKFCGLLAGHSWQQAERVAQAAIELIRPFLPPDQEDVTLLEFLLYLAELLEQRRKELTATDNRHLHELQVDRDLRRERRAKNSKVRELLLQLRDSLDGLYGPGGGNKVFEDAPSIPTDPIDVVQFTGHVLDNLGNEDFPLPKPLHKGITLDRQQIVRDLEGPHRDLEAVVKKLESTASDSKFSQTRKDAEVVATEEIAFKFVRFLEAFCDLVGLDALSDRLRLSSHIARGGEDAENPEEGEGVEPEPASEPPAEAAEAAATSGS